MDVITRARVWAFWGNAMRFYGLQRVKNELEWVKSRSSNGQAKASGGAKKFVEKKLGERDLLLTKTAGILQLIM